MKNVKDQIRVCPHATRLGNAVGDSFRLVEKGVSDLVWAAQSQLHVVMKSELEMRFMIEDAFGDGMNAGLSAAEIGTKMHDAIEDIFSDDTS